MSDSSPDAGGDVSRAQIRLMREQAWLALLLAWVAGGVDAVGYLTLVHLFTAHMSGNSAGMGAEIGTRNGSEALHRLLPIPLFILGVALGAVLHEVADRHKIRSAFALVFSVQAGLLLAMLLYGSVWLHHGVMPETPLWRFLLMVALPSLGMGLQNATLRRVGNQSIRTTYVTGMLTDMAEQSVAYLFWVYDHLRGGTRGRLRRVLRASPRQPALNRALLLVGIWGAFILGAVSGGYTWQHCRLKALILPLCGLAVVIAADLIRPIERTQSQSPKGKSG